MSRLAYERCTNCVSEEKCRLHRVMLLVRDETARILDGLSLADPVPTGSFDDGAGYDPERPEESAGLAH